MHLDSLHCGLPMETPLVLTSETDAPPKILMEEEKSIFRI